MPSKESGWVAREARRRSPVAVMISMAVTAVPRVDQWAEIARIARGVGIDRANSCQAMVKRLCSSVFIGLPCPMNTAARSERSPRWPALKRHP